MAACSPDDSLPPSQFAPEAKATVQTTTSSTWVDVLKAALAESSSSSSLELALQQASALLQEDEQWKHSGMNNMLERALRLASSSERLASAKRLATEALAFFQASQKLCAGTYSSEGKRASSSSSGRSAEDQVTCQDNCSMGHQLSTGSAGAPAEQHHFAVPTRHGRPPATPRSARAWTGSLRLETENGKSSELCQVAVQIPEEARDIAIPNKLMFSYIVQRRGVMLGPHKVCRTSLTKANTAQMARLRSMAQHELVVVAALSRGAMIMCPYLTESQSVKLVVFLVNC